MFRTIQDFVVSKFVPTEYSSCSDKVRFATAFIRFVQSDFDQKKFSKPFYNRLSNTFGHIAHYNVHGFYDHFFRSTADKIKFLEACLHRVVGSPRYTFSDVEEGLQEWLRHNGVLGKYQGRLRLEIELSERASLLAVKRRHNIPV